MSWSVNLILHTASLWPDHFNIHSICCQIKFDCPEVEIHHCLRIQKHTFMYLWEFCLETSGVTLSLHDHYHLLFGAVVYSDGQSQVWWAVRRSYRKWRHRPWHKSRERKWNHRRSRDRKRPFPEPEVTACVCATGTLCTATNGTKCSTVVQVPWLLEVTFPGEGSLVCAHAQPEVVQYSP